MDKKTALAYAADYAKIIRKEFSPLAVVLYGSYITGVPDNDSDIDIAVVFDGFNGDVLETSAKLYQYTCDVSTLIEPVLLDISGDDSGFVKEVMTTGYHVA